jgi:hypothetical protein
MENDMESDQAESGTGPQLQSPPVNEAAFRAVFDLLALAASPRDFKQRVRGLHEALVAADEAQKRLTAAQTEFEAFRTKVRLELEKERASLRKRRIAVEVGEGALVEREERIRRLEALWKPLGEPEEVRSGFREAELTPLQKARRAFGVLPETSDETFGQATLTRAAS